MPVEAAPNRPSHQPRTGHPEAPVTAAGSPLTAGGVIRALGTPGFPAAFARMVGGDFQADQVIVFRADEPGRIRTLLAENQSWGARHAHSLADSYTSSYWAKDPNARFLIPAPADAVREVVLRTGRTEDLKDGEYRHHLFTEPRLGAKASLIVRASGQVLYVNLYRRIDRGPFTPGELDGVERACDLLLALLERHFALADDTADVDLAAVQRVIERASSEAGRAALSSREAAVCARIVAGYTTEGIGIDLGVSQHSVISYRRRAFEKLGIATHKDLFALVLRRHRQLSA